MYSNPYPKDEIPKPLRAHSEPRIVRGRDVAAGNTRSWGLEFGGLVQKVSSDPVYQKCLRSVAGRTILMEPKTVNLYLLLKFYLSHHSQGSIFEFGAYRGGSTIFMAMACKELGLKFHIYGLDTFEGMPETSEELDIHRKGNFSKLKGSDDSIDVGEIQSYAQSLGLDNITFVKGLFQDTAELALKTAAPVLLAHVDCDIYEAVKYSYEVVKSKMHTEGGYIVFDDPLFGSCLGAFQAVEELVIGRDHLYAEQVYPHLVYRYPPLS